MEILSIARVVVYPPRLFKIFAKDPVVSCCIPPIEFDWQHWHDCAFASERETLYRFLNGETIVREKNSIEFIVSQPAWDDQKLLDYLFFNNRNFKIDQVFMDMPVKVDIIRDSVKLVRARSGNSELYGGPYREYKLVFSTTVQLMKPFKDLTNKELENYFEIASKVKSESSRRAWRVLKTIVKDPASIYCGRGMKFITKAPRTVEEYGRIFERELDLWHSSEFKNLVELALALGIVQKKIGFETNDQQEVALYAFFSESQHSYHKMMQIRLPRMGVHPRLFVEDVRKAVAHIRNRMEVWQNHGRICDTSIKFGDFELKSIKADRRTFWEHGTKPTTKTCIFNSKDNWQQGVRQIMELATEYLNDVLPFLEQLADFVDSLLAGTDSKDVLKVNLNKRVLESVLLSPADYLESDVQLIKNLASRCIIGC